MSASGVIPSSGRVDAMRNRTDGVTPPRRRATASGARRRAIAVLLVPFLALFLVFYIAPAVYAFISSLFATKHEGLYGAPRQEFVLFENYAAALTDPVFLKSVLRILLYGVGPTLVLILLALITALLIDARRPSILTSFFRLSAFAPYAVPGVIAAILWGFLYASSTNPVLGWLKSIGIDINMLSSSNILWGVGNVAIWTYAGYNVLIFLAQLNTIDPALYEAARIDGASNWRIALQIKLPLLRPAIVLSVIFNVIGTVQLFTEPQTLKAVSTSIVSTWTPAMMAYQAAASNNYSYAATISVLIAFVAGVCSFLVLRVSGKREA